MAGTDDQLDLICHGRIFCKAKPARLTEEAVHLAREICDDTLTSLGWNMAELNQSSRPVKRKDALQIVDSASKLVHSLR